MIDRNSILRARNTVQKCKDGSVITDKDKLKYAKKNGLTFKNGQFFNVAEDGTESVAEITDTDIADWKTDYRNNQITGVANSISAGIDVFNSMTAGSPALNDQSAGTQGANFAHDTGANLLIQAGGIPAAVGAALKTSGAISDAATMFGLKTDQMTGWDKFAGSHFGRTLGIGYFNDALGVKSDSFSLDDELFERIGGSYMGTLNDIRTAEEKAGKVFGGFSGRARRRANNLISQAKLLQERARGIDQVASDQRIAADAMGDLYSNAYSFSTQGGVDISKLRLSAKEGGKLPKEEIIEEIEFPELDEMITPTMFEEGGVIDGIINPTTGQIEDFKPQLIEEWIPEIVEPESFKTGGKIEKQLDAPEIEETTQQNIIPEGALHKNRHNMEDAEDLTKKGIPVVDDDHKQQAEIECNEIIFTKEVTQKLEELYKIYYKEESTAEEKKEAALEAGKLLTKEIMLNTDDRTGLIDALKSGGTIKKQKPAYKDWVKTVNPKMLSDYYDLEKAYELLPWTDLETWRNATLTDKVPEGDWWHLRSVADIDDNTIIFLKKGKTSKENPELQGEFDYYKQDLDFQKDWKMVFNQDENRWYYIRRKNTKKD